jgi:hypothetical protein
MRRLAFFLAVLGSGLLCARGQSGALTATLEMGQEQYLPNEDVQVKIHIVNRSGQPVAFGMDNKWITFSIVGEHEYVAPKLGDVAVKAPFTLQSGQEITREFNVTPCFDFRRPGRYRISALIQIPQWSQQIACRPVSFLISEGVPLQDLGDLTVGVSPASGGTNAAPEIRRYSLLKVSNLDDLRLYIRLTDGTGRTLRVFPLARMVSFAEPVAQIDRANNLHVLLQTGARQFIYCVINPAGALVQRQFYRYSETRPSMVTGDDGAIFVAGGLRTPGPNDIPGP